MTRSVPATELSGTVTAATPGSRGPVRTGPLAVAIFLVALNLRAALAAVPPLVGVIQRDLGLSSAAAGLLTTLPVLCMGVFAPVAQGIARRYGREVAVAAALMFLLVGQLLRLGGSVLVVLLTSTLLVGIGIALAGTVLPGIVKENFATGRSRLGPGAMTGIYLLAMMVGAASSSALSVPLSDATGSWQLSLTSWAVLSVVGIMAWIPVLRASQRPAPEAKADRVGLPWRSATAWLLAAYLAVQSWNFYSQIAWIPPTYESHGWSSRDAGLLLSLWSITQLVSGMGGPALADRLRDRRPLVAAAVACNIAGLTGIILAPTFAAVLWIVLLALGQGAGFALGLVKLVDYAPSPSASARLTAMVFLVSYSTASIGPVVFGALHDATGAFTVPFVLLLTLSTTQLALVPFLHPRRQTEA